MSQIFKSADQAAADARLGDFAAAAQYAAQESEPAPVKARLSPDDIEAAIAEEHYFTGDAALDAVRFRWLIEDHRDPKERQAARDVAERIGVMGEGGARQAVDVAMGRDGNLWAPSLGQITFCVLVLRNGAKVIGFNYGAIDPARHDPEMGRSEARAMALEKVWELEGYALRERLALIDRLPVA